MPSQTTPPIDLKLGRDLRIDFFRGLMLVMIFVNHIPGNSLSAFTLRNWGFSDAAEVFVFLAGVSAALAYGSIMQKIGFFKMIPALFKRITQIYATHIGLILVIAFLCYAASEYWGETGTMETLGMDMLLQFPQDYLLAALTLHFLPGYLDILPLYIVLLAMVPLWLALSRLHWLLPLASSAGLYVAAHLFSLNFSNIRTTHEWFFDPFAWNFIFVIGFTCGRLMRGEITLPAFSPMFRKALISLSFISVFIGVLFVAPWREIPGLENVFLINPASLGVISKSELHPVRLVDSLAKIFLVVMFLSSQSAWLQSSIARGLENIGRHSLVLYALATLFSVLGNIITALYGFELITLICINAFGIGFMLIWAQYLDYRSRGRSVRLYSFSRPWLVFSSVLRTKI